MYVWERGVLFNELCSCGSTFHSCPFWTDVMRRAVGSKEAQRSLAHAVTDLMALTCRSRHVPGMVTGRQRAETGHARRRLQELLAPVYREALVVSGKRIVVDASKEPQYSLALTGGVFEITPIHLIRDGRAVAYSWRRGRLRPEIHWDSREMARRGSVRASLEWNRANVLAEILQYCVGEDRSHRVRYELLASDPNATLRDVRAWVELHDSADDATVGDVMWHTVSGNPSRFQPLEAIRQDAEWVDGFRGPARLAADVLTLPCRLRYGYL